MATTWLVVGDLHTRETLVRTEFRTTTVVVVVIYMIKLGIVSPINLGGYMTGEMCADTEESLELYPPCDKDSC